MIRFVSDYALSYTLTYTKWWENMRNSFQSWSKGSELQFFLVLS